jgi:hypothetical protein
MNVQDGCPLGAPTLTLPRFAGEGTNSLPGAAEEPTNSLPRLRGRAGVGAAKGSFSQ